MYVYFHDKKIVRFIKFECGGVCNETVSVLRRYENRYLIDYYFFIVKIVIDLCMIYNGFVIFYLYLILKIESKFIIS